MPTMPGMTEWPRRLRIAVPSLWERSAPGEMAVIFPAVMVMFWSGTGAAPVPSMTWTCTRMPRGQFVCHLFAADETARGMRYCFKNAPYQYRAEQDGKQGACCAVPSPWVSGEAGEAMAQEGRGGRLEQEPSFWVGKFCQRRNQLSATGALNDGLVAGELSIECQARASDPNQWMKPQTAKHKLVHQT